MTWRLSVEHVTTYSYAGDVFASYNEARLTPTQDERQLVLDHHVHLTPHVPIFHYVDYWGSAVCSFDVTAPHRRLVVTGRSLVETAPARPLPEEGIKWDTLRAESTRDDFYQYLTSSAFVPCDDARVAQAAGELTAGEPSVVVRRVCEWTREHLVYEPGATDVSTTASGALDVGRGVCQDFVHVAIAVLRGCGIPARYASGYFHPDEDAGIGNRVTGQSHAWLEAWLDAWYPVDPTSGAPVGTRHVLVARGRDYGDVTPIKGVFHGPPDPSVDVRVAIERVA
jgi:transglutaminase-like putative cysteine protease